MPMRLANPFRPKQLATAIGLSVAALVMLSGSVQAADLKLGIYSEVTTLDPHFNNIAPNVSMSANLFDALINVSPDGQLVPGLAISWKATGPTTWEIRLRHGVVFSDGTPLTAEDVIFSLERPATLTRSPGPFTSYTKQITAHKIVAPDTIQLKTATPYGPLPLDLSTIYIVSKKAAAGASPEDFDSGKAAIGTGPLKLAPANGFRRGDRIELVRNDHYWGAKEPWDHVTFRILTSDAARVAALLAGEVDAIDNVPPADVSRLRTNDAMRLAQKISWRTLFFTMDQSRDVSPDITDANGKPLSKNPLKDKRVREAISLAINRQALTARTLEGLGVPTANLVAPGILGYAKELAVDRYDPAAAKKLLADAGYPNGFGLTLHGPNNRYINDERVVQAVAQFLSRIGIKARVDTLPLSVYFGKARNGDFSMAMLGWGTLAADFGLRTLLGTANAETGWGTWNWGKYSNAEVDRHITESLASVDQDVRAHHASEGMTAAMHDYAVIPLYNQYATWAMKKNVTYTPRTDEFTLAFQFSPAK